MVRLVEHHEQLVARRIEKGHQGGMALRKRPGRRLQRADQNVVAGRDVRRVEVPRGAGHDPDVDLFYPPSGYTGYTPVERLERLLQKVMGVCQPQHLAAF